MAEIIKAKKCLHCEELPAIFSSLGNKNRWSFRHECKTGMVATGSKLESEEAAIKAWNGMCPKMKDKEVVDAMKPLSDPYQRAHKYVAVAEQMQGMAVLAKEAGKPQQADTMILTSVVMQLRSDIWYQIFVDKCYKEGMSPDEIFAPPKKQETQA